MTGKKLFRLVRPELFALALLGSFGQSVAQESVSLEAEPPSGVNCTFKSEPDRFLEAEVRAFQAAFDRGVLANRMAAGDRRAVAIADIPRVNYIDNQIFEKMLEAGVSPAPIAGDHEFVRRIYLDLTGRIPTPAQVREFTADSNPRKRDRLIDTLLYSPEFTHKWMLWLGDVMQNAAANSFRSIQVNGRNAYHYWLLSSLAENKSVRDIVWEALTGKGINYLEAQANWNVRSGTGGGPGQDTYDTAFSRAASQFMGMSHYDCILCHNGRGHLEGLSQWGVGATRVEAWRMAAFYSRLRLGGVTNVQTDPLFNSTNVTEATTGLYDLNTTFGNRPTRAAIGATRSLTPQWRDGTEAPAREWMAAFADNLVRDRMFARNFANRIWKQVFNLGLVEPVDQLDPARLDPAKPPATGGLQATHPVLLEELADNLVALNFGLREFVRVLVSSSAYQLSSRYDGEWKISSVPLFARHYPRRLEGEEIHDALQVATGVMGSYTVRGWTDPVRWAVQLPEPAENTAASGFMNAFFRGNRDTLDRSQDGSILQRMSLMNDGQVLNRIRVSASATMRQIAAMTDNGAAVEELFLVYLSRLPSAVEKETAIRHITSRGAANRNSSFEDLAWALVNRPEFIFSY